MSKKEFWWSGEIRYAPHSPGVILRNGQLWVCAKFWGPPTMHIVLGVRGFECAAKALAGQEAPAPQPDPYHWPYSAEHPEEWNAREWIEGGDVGWIGRRVRYTLIPDLPHGTVAERTDTGPYLVEMDNGKSGYWYAKEMEAIDG